LSIREWQQASDIFLKVINTIPDNQRKAPGVCGEWSCQQIIAHLAGWQREATRRFEAFQQGDPSNATYDIVTFNATSVEALKLFNWKETVETLVYTCDDMQALYKQRPSDDPRYDEWFIAMTKEFKLHTAQIQAWLEENA
jgi:hypothetical protein